MRLLVCVFLYFVSRYMQAEGPWQRLRVRALVEDAPRLNGTVDDGRRQRYSALRGQRPGRGARRRAMDGAADGGHGQGQCGGPYRTILGEPLGPENIGALGSIKEGHWVRKWRAIVFNCGL